MVKIYYAILLILLPLISFAQLSDITRVTLNFVPTSGALVSATATDAGSGLVVDGPINLMESTDYTLSIVLNNGEMDITSEVTTNGNDLQFFFAPEEDLFEGGVEYDDMDGNGLPIGIVTNWTSGCVGEEDVMGGLRITLNNLSGAKSASSTIDDGTSIFDLTWDVTLADDAEAPECENEEEVIDRVTLTFTPMEGDPIIAIATDPDGPGPMDLQVEDITLMESTDYTLSIKLENTMEGEDITEEIMEEDDEHLFLFGFGEGVFDDPDGDGNIDNRDDPVNYGDMDDGGLPVGLLTDWTTACTVEGNVTDIFRVVLKHQPDIKSATSGFDDGGTDLDITWNVTIMDDAEAPECENEEEVIDRVTLTFTPAEGDPIVAIASDPDGPGPMDLQVEDITLMESTDYALSIKLENTMEGEDITEEIMEEDDEHLFLFGFGEDLFDDPDGDGNIDDRDDPVDYADMDDNGLPVGLLTDWTTACTAEGDATGAFRVVLKHQPDIKSATSGFDDGGTDIDITWNMTIMDDMDAPECENEEELIDRVTLTFIPEMGTDTIVAVATDPDGPGPMDLQVEPINLVQNTTYELSIMVENTIEGEDITEEIEEEDEEHQFFFAWTGDIFSDPTGDGNIDNRDDPVNYNDQDDNGLPIGLSTNWTTNVAMSPGTFRVVLKHQPDIKSETSTSEDGGTDIDITWDVNTVVTSLDNLSENQSLVIAPNPVVDEIVLLTENVDLQDAEVVIYSALGTAVKVLQNPQNSINISDLPVGKYVLQVQSNQLNVTRQVVKIK